MLFVSTINEISHVSQLLQTMKVFLERDGDINDLLGLGASAQKAALDDLAETIKVDSGCVSAFIRCFDTATFSQKAGNGIVLAVQKLALEASSPEVYFPDMGMDPAYSIGRRNLSPVTESAEDPSSPNEIQSPSDAHSLDNSSVSRSFGQELENPTSDLAAGLHTWLVSEGQTLSFWTNLEWASVTDAFTSAACFTAESWREELCALKHRDDLANFQTDIEHKRWYVAVSGRALAGQCNRTLKLCVGRRRIVLQKSRKGFGMVISEYGV